MNDGNKKKPAPLDVREIRPEMTETERARITAEITERFARLAERVGACREKEP